MTGRVGVLLLGAGHELGDRVVGAIASGDALGEVRAVEACGSLAEVELACRRLEEVTEEVIGLAAVPWPGWSVWHETARVALGELPYWAIETWHGLPALADALVEAAGAAWVDGSRVLLTAPDEALRALPPEQRVLLRDVAAALHERTSVRPTVAVDRSPAHGAVTPTAVTSVETLATAHGATSLVRLSLRPADGPDDEVSQTATRHGVSLRDVALSADAQVALLCDAVRTLLAHRLQEPAS